jgi:hypothetical protein
MSRLLIIAAGSVAVVAAVLTLIWTMQRRLMYFPIADVPTPGEIGLSDVEPVTFETTDALRLNGRFVAASGPLPRVTVLVFNGNAGNRTYRAPRAAAFQRHGLQQVLLVDYRGYGGNARTPTENGLATDGRTAPVYLPGRADVDASRIVYFGESLRAWRALQLSWLCKARSDEGTVSHGRLGRIDRQAFASETLCQGRIGERLARRGAMPHSR